MGDSQTLIKQLNQLKPWQLTAVSAAFTERMLPNFMLFSKLLNFGDTAKVRTVMDGVWQHLSGGAKMNFEVQLDHIDSNIPSLDEFDMYGAMPAHDAVVALYSTLTSILEEDASEVLSVISLSHESVATFIEVNQADTQMSDVDLMRFISTHELMQDEDAFTEEVFERILSQEHPDKAFIQSLRTLAENQGISNIGISDSE